MADHQMVTLRVKVRDYVKKWNPGSPVDGPHDDEAEAVYEQDLTMPVAVAEKVKADEPLTNSDLAQITEGAMRPLENDGTSCLEDWQVCNCSDCDALRTSTEADDQATHEWELNMIASTEDL